ncbi:hypothetical protein SO802_009573 [Lithocarpus litseifolius]|uniref:Secoisolariciresinol dehydrogenase n=1 Tax=Lithocarpus litseifolius TaxID=425828 RepID=A0AAW2DG42_9ROSI
MSASDINFPVYATRVKVFNALHLSPCLRHQGARASSRWVIDHREVSTTCKDKLHKTIVLCCYGVIATTEKEIFIVALREALGAVCTLLEEYIMLLSCWLSHFICQNLVKLLQYNGLGRLTYKGKGKGHNPVSMEEDPVAKEPAFQGEITKQFGDGLRVSFFIFTHILTCSTMASFSLVSAAARRLEGKVALITGGASGIGESTARIFSKHGAKVVIADIQDELGHSVCKELNPQSSSFVHCDVTKETEVENAVNHAVSKYGKLDIMFNNAGIAGAAKLNILDTTKAEFEQVVSVNLVGAFLGTKHAARVMIPARKGSIITTASTSSIIGGGATHGYTSSKHGVVGLMRNTAVELGQFGIRANCVSPYAIATPLLNDFLKQLDTNRISSVFSSLKDEVLRPEDVAEAALYLGSDESKYVSGHNLVIDGGFTIVNSSFCLFAQS